MMATTRTNDNGDDDDDDDLIKGISDTSDQ